MSESKLAMDSQAEFDRLQKKLVPLWKSIERFNQDPQTIVVVPSMSIDAISSGAVTFSVLVVVAASASCPADLCDFTNDSAEHHRLLPESSARCDSQSCPPAPFPHLASRPLGTSIERQAARAATATGAHPFVDHGSRSRAPCSF